MSRRPTKASGRRRCGTVVAKLEKAANIVGRAIIGIDIPVLSRSSPPKGRTLEVHPEVPPAKRRRIDKPATRLAQSAAAVGRSEASSGICTASMYKPSDASVPLALSVEALNSVAPIKKESQEGTLPPASQIVREPFLVKQGTYRIHPVPIKYRRHTADSAKLREQWKKEQAGLLQQRGLKARVQVVRTKLLGDGLIIDWISEVPVSPDTLQPLEADLASATTLPLAPPLGLPTPDSVRSQEAISHPPSTPTARPTSRSTSARTPSHASSVAVLPPTPTSLAPHQRHPPLPASQASGSPNPCPVPRKPRIPAIVPRGAPSSTPARPPTVSSVPPPSTPANQGSYVPLPRVPRPSPRIPAIIKSSSKTLSAPAPSEVPTPPRTAKASSPGDAGTSLFAQLKQRLLAERRDEPLCPASPITQSEAPRAGDTFPSLRRTGSLTIPAFPSTTPKSSPEQTELKVSEVIAPPDRPRFTVSEECTSYPADSMDIDNEPPEHPPPSSQDTEAVIPVPIINAIPSPGTTPVSISSQPPTPPRVYRSPSKQPPVIFSAVPDVPRPTTQECADLEAKALNWLRRYIDEFDSDRASLASAYSQQATFSHRITSHLTAPPVVSTTPSELHSGTLNILSALIDLPESFNFNVRDAASVIEYDLVVVFDIIVYGSSADASGGAAGPAVMLMCYVDPAHSDTPDADGGRWVCEMQCVLRQKGWDAQDSSMSALWDLVAVSHHMTLRRIPADLKWVWRSTGTMKF